MSNPKMMKSIYRLVLLLTASLVLDCTEGRDIPIPSTRLESGSDLPLISLAVDGTPDKEVRQRIYDAMQNSTEYTVYDTSQRIKNERAIIDGIVMAVKSSALHSSQVHVTTKVPYTHLGYERTKLAVQESLQTLKSRNTKVHVLLEWPRCDDNISWMECEHDEKDLPERIKAVGPPPHLNKEFAFLDSWRALEDIYLGDINLGDGLPSLASIGVANFEVEDLRTLEMHSRVHPHILQKNVWSFVYDPFLVDYCHQNLVHFQASNVIHEVFGKNVAPPRALGNLHSIAKDLPELHGVKVTPEQLVLKWLVQKGVSVTAFVQDNARLHEYSPVSIASIQNLSRSQSESIESSVAAMLKGEDLPPPTARFHNRLKEGLLQLFWLNEATGEEVPLEKVQAGDTYVAMSHLGHKFIAYVDQKRKEMVVDRSYGQSQRFLIDEL